MSKLAAIHAAQHRAQSDNQTWIVYHDYNDLGIPGYYIARQPNLPIYLRAKDIIHVAN